VKWEKRGMGESPIAEGVRHQKKGEVENWRKTGGGQMVRKKPVESRRGRGIGTGPCGCSGKLSTRRMKGNQRRCRPGGGPGWGKRSGRGTKPKKTHRAERYGDEKTTKNKKRKKTNGKTTLKPGGLDLTRCWDPRKRTDRTSPTANRHDWGAGLKCTKKIKTNQGDIVRGGFKGD